MAGEVVLTRRSPHATGTAVGLVLSLLCGTAAAGDDPADSPLRAPERLTVGVADDLLGQLSVDGKTLYYVSNRNTTNQLFAQNVADGRARQLFDDNADVTWPRVSPDGGSLLYVSYRDEASGRLCVRTLPDGGGRRCLEGSSAALQAEWIDRDHIALVSRQTIEGELRVLDVDARATLTARPLLDRSVSSPAISPDGRWLVYVPVSRTTDRVGPAFAAHASQQLDVVKLGSSTPVAMSLELPGQTGQPAFSRDGRSLYVVQFFTDTNHDGAVDARDNGVLFRVPISFAGDTPSLGAPEQLTLTSWNCQYPAPFFDRLIMTCSEDGSLDVYSLPLDGEVPPDWTAETLAAALETDGTRVEHQLLASLRVARETTAAGRRRAMLALVMVHLDGEEFRAAEYYVEHLDAVHDDATAGISAPLKLLVDQRRASRRREQGRMMEGFGAEARKRLDSLRSAAAPSRIAADLSHLVRSEITDSIGEKTTARSELEAITIDGSTPKSLVVAYYHAADALYRELDDREALVSVCEKLSRIAAVSPDERLRYARAAVRAMVRGLPRDEARVRIESELAHVHLDDAPPDSELAFALELGGAVLSIGDAHPPATVTSRLLQLYARESRGGRRRALVSDAMRRAGEVEANELLEALARTEIENVKRGSRERASAERLYRRTMIARAYERAAQQKYEEARDDFDAVARETGSYEALVGAIDMRLKTGEAHAEILARYDEPGAKPAMSRFAKAYLIARQLPKLDGEPHARAAATALASLQASWSDLKEQRIAQALFGALLHEEYLMTHDVATAERANVHYLVALELMGQNARFRAMILGELGLLHTDVGNYRIALGYLSERDKLPYTDNSEGLDVRVSEAEALLHVARDADAVTAAEQAISMIERNPALARYRVLALDWAALSNLAAGHFARALALYGEEIPLLDAAGKGITERNRVVARVSRAAAAIGAGQPALALPDLDYLDARLGDAAVRETLRWPHATTAHVTRTYRLIAAGLRASAYRGLGQLEREAPAIEERRALLGEQFADTGRVEVEQQQMLADAQLAINASERGDSAAAAAALGSALNRGDDLRARAGGVSSKEVLDMLLLAAELSVSMRRSLVLDLPKRIDTASLEMLQRRDSALGPYQRWFEIYGPLVAPVAIGSSGGAAASPSSRP